ncbi:hypothetical protein IEQ34_019765 [Dendrobium chrysotoxum]|uniref:Uncharacterized protein n=1 Tax=Dendrobium chrysotoxum TaxID=161865 RepID=A0AAV7G8D6_DENCH|nr:hypothetical protein IEQ34_019765 [Dendrobium chrysotoxum]
MGIGIGKNISEAVYIGCNEDMAENIDLILDGKIKKHKFIGNTLGDSTKLKDPLKRRPKDISNARVKGY